MVLRGVPSKIRVLVTDSDGEPVAEDNAREVNVSVLKDSDGSEVVTAAKAKWEGVGVYVYELPAISLVDRLTNTWSTSDGAEFTTYEEVVGGRICALSSITDQIGTGSETPSDETLRVAREIAEAVLEDECGVAFRPRYSRVVLDGQGSKKLLLPHPKLNALRSVKLEGVVVDIEDLKIYTSGGSIWREEAWPEGTQNVEVVYEHGFLYPPGQASRACALLARHIATKRLSNLDDRATSISTDEAAYTVIQAGVRGMATAIPEVNAFISSWQFPQVT